MAIHQDNRDYIERLSWLRIFFVLAIAVLGARLWHLSVIRYDKYSALAENNQIRTIPLAAPRGQILDREGRALAENTYGFDLVLFRDDGLDLDATFQFLSQGLGISRETLKLRLSQAGHYGAYQPVVLKENLSMNEVAFLAARRSDHPELEFFKQPRRLYRYKQLAAHALGYVGEVSREELSQDEFDSNKPGDQIGKYGLERAYNRRLMGVDGSQRVLVNSRGKRLQELDVDPPLQGQSLKVTLDLDLQMAAEMALGEAPGAVVAFKPDDGEVLVMASRPAFDPNQFASRISRQEWSDLINNPEHPLQNRVIQSNFSPGSIFKVVVALAGLERGAVNLRSSVYCDGGVTLYDHRFRCWKAEGHGRVSLVDAIQHSCNVYFYLLGQKLGIEALAEFSRQVGLGQATGIDLDGESSGLVPTPAWKKRTTGDRWYAGETISVSIGQGPVNVTPIQLARAVGAVATGKFPRLHLKSGDAAREDAPAASLPVAAEHLQAVREGMWRVVNEWGTGHGARVPGFDVCGKTGTVQTISKATKAKLSKEQAKKFVPNAWFVGFAPRDNPEIVVAALVQRGGSGSARAAPVAGEIFKAYYAKREAYLNAPVGTDAGLEVAVKKPKRSPTAGGSF